MQTEFVPDTFILAIIRLSYKYKRKQMCVKRLFYITLVVYSFNHDNNKCHSQPVSCINTSTFGIFNMVEFVEPILYRYMSTAFKHLARIQRNVNGMFAYTPLLVFVLEE